MAANTQSPIITRFAPSPTGFLHSGHALAADYAFGFARDNGGRCLLRIEDIDHTRCKPEFTDAIFEDLSWLGFDWPTPVRVQSEHRSDYLDVIEALTRKGLAYPCTKSRSEIKANIQNRGIKAYIRDTGEALPSNTDHAAWRLSISACRAALGSEFDQLCYEAIIDGQKKWQSIDASIFENMFGDVIIGRKDIGVSYHIAVTHDDHLQNITHVVRGQDLEDQTAVHVLIQKIMGWETPIYSHHPLRLRGDGQKLAKRNSDPSIRSLRAQGVMPEELLR